MKKILLILFMVNIIGATVICLLNVNLVAGSSSNSPVCDDSLWDHVYYPARLQMLNPCITASGTVTMIDPSPDGDYHVNIKLDPQYSYLLNQANFDYQNGELVTEIVCAKDASFGPANSACGSFSETLNVSIGDHVQVTGSYVTDNGESGWNEIHPVTSYVKIPVDPLKGDIDNDSKITAADALLYLRYAVGLNTSPFQVDPKKDDVTCDGKITAADALKVLRKAVGQNVDLTTC